MEQKKIQRIIGIIVVIALVIVVMPLLFGKNDFPLQQASNIKAPPFPDQTPTTDTPDAQQTATAALASATDSTPNSAVSQTNNPAAPVSANADLAANSTNSAPVDGLPQPPILSSEQSEQIDQAPDINKSIVLPASQVDPSATSIANATPEKTAADASPTTTITTTTTSKTPSSATATPAPTTSAPENKPAPAVGSIIYEPASVTPAVTADSNAQKSTTDVPVVTHQMAVASTAAMNKPVVVKTLPVVVKQKSVYVKPIQSIQAKVRKPVLTSAKSAGWVVQVGNFAIKKNAIHLSSKLQAAGYKVFAKEIKTRDGRVFTRVFVGPASQASASQVSNDIYQKLSVKGFLVSYKPTKV